MKELREHNENMLRNILPSHVARHFLEKDRDNEVRPGPSAGTAGCRWGAGGAWTHGPRALGAARRPPAPTREWRPRLPRGARPCRLPNVVSAHTASPAPGPSSVRGT